MHFSAAIMQPAPAAAPSQQVLKMKSGSLLPTHPQNVVEALLVGR